MIESGHANKANPEATDKTSTDNKNNDIMIYRDSYAQTRLSSELVIINLKYRHNSNEENKKARTLSEFVTQAK